jgi:hypothetical protein
MFSGVQNWWRRARKMNRIGLVAWGLLSLSFIAFTLREFAIGSSVEPLVFGWIPRWLFNWTALTGFMIILYLIIFFTTVKQPDDFINRIEEES